MRINNSSFGFNKNYKFFYLTIKNNCLKETDNVKFLGICVDQNLSLDHHTDIVCNKVSKAYFYWGN